MFKIISKREFRKITELNEKFFQKNRKLKEVIEQVDEKYLGISSDKAIDIAIELLKNR